MGSIRLSIHLSSRVYSYIMEGLTNSNGVSKHGNGINGCSNGSFAKRNGLRKMSEREGVRLMNPHIQDMEEDVLYHLALGSGSHDLEQMFGDVRFICMGGTPQRMKTFAEYMLGQLGYLLPTGTCLLDISERSHRYAMYKVGPVLSISHGMGIPSAGILLHEVIKLMYHAGVKDPIFFRIGTCGGIGLPPGTVVVTEEAVDGRIRPVLDTIILGKVVSRKAKLDLGLAKNLVATGREEDEYETVLGKTISTDDFYEGQGRLDGAICEHTESEKLAYLQDVADKGVTNMEMEALVFAALTHLAGIRSAVVCVTLLDRLKGDQVTTPKEELTSWQARPMEIVSRFILKELSMGQRKASAPTIKNLARKSSKLFIQSQSCFEDA